MRYVSNNTPCANKIHIAMSDDNQIPMWSNASFPKINIVTHSDGFEEQSY